MSKLRVAVIGTGMIANSAHFPALNDLRKEGLVEVVGVADIRQIPFMLHGGVALYRTQSDRTAVGIKEIVSVGNNCLHFIFL